MKKKSTLPPREQFCARFLRKLQSYSTTDPVIALILKTKIRRDQCAALFWNCVNDVPARLAGISHRRHDFWAGQYETAIRGADAFALIAQENGNSEFAALMLRAKEAVLGLQRNLPVAFPPAQVRGRNGRDWGVVQYAQRILEGYLDGERISDATLASLLDAAEEVAGSGKTVTKNAVRMGLARLRENLPAAENVLTKFYPRGDKFSPPARTQLAQK
jgi:hypothetical protein